MRFDVSEIKAYRTCTRQWQLSSRNQFHMTKKVAPTQFATGIIFHEALSMMYLGSKLESVMNFVHREMNPEEDKALLAMIPGYYNTVLADDLNTYRVLDIEHHFELLPTKLNRKNRKEDIQICGSIDMIVLDKHTNKLYGFEHKTCKSFRDETYIWMDEQPRIYFWALMDYARKYNDKMYMNWKALNDGSQQPTPVTVGGIFLNEVKKLLRDFQYSRTLCYYTLDDLTHFLEEFFKTCTKCKAAINKKAYIAPQASYFACKMCMFNKVCAKYMYSELKKETILNDFSEDFIERKEDHLNEKVERSVEV